MYARHRTNKWSQVISLDLYFLCSKLAGSLLHRIPQSTATQQQSWVVHSGVINCLRLRRKAMNSLSLSCFRVTASNYTVSSTYSDRLIFLFLFAARIICERFLGRYFPPLLLWSGNFRFCRLRSLGSLYRRLDSRKVRLIRDTWWLTNFHFWHT